MGVFHFKKFDVCDDRSAMKVGTDGVLLGSATEVSMNITSALDIGTGCGLVALMLAQRLAQVSEAFRVTGIDIEEGAAADAEVNFRQSPWRSHLCSMNMSLKALEATSPEMSFDLIVSNPPYYDNSLEAPRIFLIQKGFFHTRKSLNMPKRIWRKMGLYGSYFRLIRRKNSFAMPGCFDLRSTRY